MKVWIVDVLDEAEDVCGVLSVHASETTAIATMTAWAGSPDRRHKWFQDPRNPLRFHCGGAGDIRIVDWEVRP